MKLIEKDLVELPHCQLRGPLEIDAGSYLLKGPNGVGKSSLFRLLKKNLFDKSIAFLDQERLAPLVNFYVEDFFNLINEEFRPVLRQKITRDAQLVTKLDVPYLFNKKVLDLSGGENQLVKIAFCLSLEKDWYFLDEPFQNLSQENSEKVLDLLIKLRAEGKHFFIIEHDDEKVQALVDSTLRMELKKGVAQVV